MVRIEHVRCLQPCRWCVATCGMLVLTNTAMGINVLPGRSGSVVASGALRIGGDVWQQVVQFPGAGVALFQSTLLPACQVPVAALLSPAALARVHVNTNPGTTSSLAASGSDASCSPKDVCEAASAPPCSAVGWSGAASWGPDGPH
eukprot:scaffold30763_cov30-Tisochrysis_lutea.AAC.4